MVKFILKTFRLKKKIEERVGFTQKDVMQDLSSKMENPYTHSQTTANTAFNCVKNPFQ